MNVESLRGMKPAWWGSIAVFLLIAGLCIHSIQGGASSSGVVSGATALNIRTGAGTEYENVTTSDGTKLTLPNGYRVTILDEIFDKEERKWYQISVIYGGETLEGYALASYINKRTDVVTDGEFEAYLEEQGFPESYKEGLRFLHTEHPSWQFVAVQTGLDWETSVDEESVVGKNLIPNSAISSWKSMETGAYDWDTNKWVVFDGSDWVAASRDLIAYYMDPRNFLDEINVFQFETLSYDNSYQTIDGIEKVLKGSFMDASYTDSDGWSGTYADAFLYAAEKSGVSPYHLASRSLQEVGNNGSSSVSGTVSGYEGYYNFYNIGATSSSNPILNGLSFAKQYNESYYLPWDTKWKAITGGAIYLGNRYINVGQDTLYMQKFNVQGSNPYNHQYMTNVQAPSSEARHMATAYNGAELSIVFKIPVFENMPGSPCDLPTGSGSSVTALESLSVEGYHLSPTFHKNITEYDLILPDNSVTSVEIKAKAIDSTATLSNTGKIDLTEGLNVIHITVQAQNGSATVYTINITVPTGPSTFDGGAYYVTAPGREFITVEVDGTEIVMLHGFEIGMTMSDAISNMTSTNCGIRLVNSERTDGDGVIATGTLLQITANSSGEVMREIPIVIYGDINGDGSITGKDMLYLQRHVLGISALSGVYEEAADIKEDEKFNAQGNKITTINAKDILYLQRHLLEMQQIEQKIKQETE